MKHRNQFLVALTAALLSASSVAERAVRPIGLGKPSAADHRRAKSLGLDLTKPYAAARKILAKTGWASDLHEDSPHSYPEFPEIVCGNGMDAICSARFIKDGKAIQLTVDQNSKTLLVVHIDDD